MPRPKNPSGKPSPGVPAPPPQSRGSETPPAEPDEIGGQRAPTHPPALPDRCRAGPDQKPAPASTDGSSRSGQHAGLGPSPFAQVPGSSSPFRQSQTGTSAGPFLPSDPALCRTCGACCAYCRILVNWTEVDDFAPGGIPASMTVRLGEHVRIMAGTEGPPGRCVALEGRIGHFVTCSIYDRRGTLCREFNPEHDDGSPNEMCDRARRAHGLPPLERQEKLSDR